MKKLYYFAQRPLCRGIGLVGFLGTVGVLAAGLAWSLPVLQAVGDTVQLSGVRAALGSQLGAAHKAGAVARARLRLCASNDGLMCAESGSWSQGWIAFDDRNGDGRRDRTERVLHKAGAMPLAFDVVGDLNASAAVVCRRAPGHAHCAKSDPQLPLVSAGFRPRLS
jgi:Tfp pilus assembly protein FimT